MIKDLFKKVVNRFKGEIEEAEDISYVSIHPLSLDELLDKIDAYKQENEKLKISVMNLSDQHRKVEADLRSTRGKLGAVTAQRNRLKKKLDREENEK